MLKPQIDELEAERDVLQCERDRLVQRLNYSENELRVLRETCEGLRKPKHGGCPPHYDLGAVGEVLDVCRVLGETLPEEFEGAFIGGMYLELVKYVLRAPRKNGVDDLRKAKHYIDIIIKELGV
ncbi:MAG: DUF3310 domain-containing protein [Betaproteobacteria bacterium]